MLKIRNCEIFALTGVKSMEIIGIIKEIDNLGRLVIPKSLRVRYGISGKVEIITTKEGILSRAAEDDTKK